MTSIHHTKNGQKFTIRQPTENDAEAIINHSKLIFESTDQVLTTLDEFAITVEQEKAWINSFNQSRNSIVLIAEMNNKILGLLFFIAGPKVKNSHTGEFGVNVNPAFQGLGIGRKLIETLLQWAKDNKMIEKVFLKVIVTNEKAIRLYKDLGFIEEGRHIKAIKQLSGEYFDVLQMYVETK